jgi:DNA-directed RNA polymerase specialized sigma24 family protein
VERYFKALKELKGGPVMNDEQVKKYADRVGDNYAKALKELQAAGVTPAQAARATGVPVETIMQRIKGANAPNGIASIMPKA